MLQNQTFCYPYFYGNKESEMTLFRSYGSYPPPPLRELASKFLGAFWLFSTCVEHQRDNFVGVETTMATSVGIENDCYVERSFEHWYLLYARKRLLCRTMFCGSRSMRANQSIDACDRPNLLLPLKI